MNLELAQQSPATLNGYFPTRRSGKWTLINDYKTLLYLQAQMDHTYQTMLYLQPVQSSREENVNTSAQ